MKIPDLVWMKSDDADSILTQVIDALQACDDFSADNVSSVLQPIINQHGAKFVCPMVRFALAGQFISPAIHDSISLYYSFHNKDGKAKDKLIARLKQGQQSIRNMPLDLVVPDGGCQICRNYIPISKSTGQHYWFGKLSPCKGLTKSQT